MNHHPEVSDSNYSSQASLGIKSVAPLDGGDLIHNPVLAQKRSVTVAVYGVAMCSAPIFLTTYGVLFAELGAIVDFGETGNCWTFLVFLASTVTVLALSTTLVWIHYSGKRSLTSNFVAGADLILVLCWAGVLMVALGAAENVQDRSQCGKNGVRCTKNSAPTKISTFGAYIQKVCVGGSAQSNKTTYSAAASYERATGKTPSPHSSFARQTGNGRMKAEDSKPDPEKCEAAKWLQRVIFSMYSWVILLFILGSLEIIFGLGAKWNKKLPEFVPQQPT